MKTVSATDFLVPRRLATDIRHLALAGGALLALIAAGCSSMHTLAIAPGNTATFDVDPDGTMVLRSQKKHAVAVRPLTARFSNSSDRLPAFSVIVTNGGARNLGLTARDVRAYSGDQPVAILDAPTLQRRFEHDYHLNQPPDSSGGGRDASQSATVHRQYPSESSPSSSLPVERPDPTDPKRTPLGAGLPPPPAPALNELLRLQTIRPGETGGGRVVLDTREIDPAVPLKIVVKVDGEEHTFLFSVKE